ncbi:hypothetical protein LOD99_11366 [Oopsacas minuta]|uniref:AIG1-type G domain-containing protein n=1 Tax=Oopsacas minuta TaxID=111878 RepID=A0AAV7K3U8_9METZ|nr:hypothetical protein LOD99_11366 [Oopsacas minuta]
MDNSIYNSSPKGIQSKLHIDYIDTPGFGDTKGIQRDTEITKQIQKFFTATGNLGIDHINAVGLVAQSSLSRLTFTQKYILDQILLLFGKDISENIYLMLTFVDGQVPQVLNGIKEANLPYQDYFKFNNSISPKSLTQTKLVLEERERIETQIEGLQIEAKLGLSKLEQLKNEVEIVLQHESDINRNEDFTYVVAEDQIVKHDIEPNTYVTNCLKCYFTCSYANDDDKHKCSAMDGGGKTDAHCTVCTNRCHWTQHKNMRYYFTTERKLLLRYQDANGRVKSTQQIVNDMVDEFEEYKKLDKIALKPHSPSTSQYISILIESEKSSVKPGWQSRVQQLTEVKEKINNLTEITQEGFDPFETYKRKIQEERQTKQGVWCAVDAYLQKIQYWVV